METMRHTIGAQHIGDLIRDKNIVLKGADVLSQRGFTQVPNHLLRSDKISAGAKLAYTMLLSYAWQNDFCFPGQERLAKDMGAGERSVVRCTS
jgi:Helix-turn-helix domain